MSERFNPARKEAWTILDAKTIAKFFGYYCTQPFKSALNDFILRYVVDATATKVLGACVEGYLNDIKPPLRKMKYKIPDLHEKNRVVDN